MAYILGNRSMVKYKSLRLWAENGRICMEDGENNSFQTLSVDETERRVSAIYESLTTHGLSNNKKEYAWYSESIAAQWRFAREMEELLRTAREQGEPFDPSARRDYKARAPKTFILPTGLGRLKREVVN